MTSPAAETLLADLTIAALTMCRRRRLPLSIAVDDLVQDGALGALEALPRFDQAFGASLRTFLGHRARGAMLDARRRYDPLSRSMRSAVQRGAAAFVEIPLDAALTTHVDAGHAATVEARVAVGRLLEHLTRRERYVLEQHCLAGRTLVEIGHDLHLSHSRVFQLKHDALARLRAFVKGRS